MPSTQVSPFEPVKFYDAPNVALTQLFEGDATFRGMMGTFITDDAALSPQERNNYTSRIKAATGDTSVGNAIVDVATNPWVWLGFLFSPVGGAVGRRTGRFYQEHVRTSMLPKILQTGNWLTDGTPGGVAVAGLGKSIDDMGHEWNAHLVPAERRALEALGVKKLDPETIRDPHKAQRAKRILYAIWGSLSGVDRQLQVGKTRFAPTFYVQETDDAGRLLREREVTNPDDIKALLGKYDDIAKGRGFDEMTADLPAMQTIDESLSSLQLKTYRSGRVRAAKGREDWKHYTTAEQGRGTDKVSESWTNGGSFESILRAEGEEFWDLRNTIQDVMKMRFARQYMKPEVVKGIEKSFEASGQVVFPMTEKIGDLLDPSKVKRLWAGLHDQNLIGRNLAEEDAIALVMGRDARAQILARDAKYTAEKFDEDVLRTFESMVNLDFYMPRNMISWHGMQKVRPFSKKTKVVELPDSLVQSADNPRQVALTSSGSVRPRTKDTSQVAWAKEDLEEFDRLFPEFHSVLNPRTGETGNRVVQNMQAESIRAVAEQADLGRAAPLLRIKLMPQLMRYQAQTARDIALFVDDIGEGVRVSQRRIFEQWVKQGKDPKEFPHLRFPREYAPGAGELPPVMQVFDAASEAPPGGWNRAHVLHQTEMMQPLIHPPTPHGQRQAAIAQQMLRDTLLPTALGTMHHEHGFIRSGIEWAQYATSGLLDSRPFQMIEDSLGKGSEAFKDTAFAMKRFAEGEAGRYVPRVLRESAGYLYTTHLGLNMGSVILNMQQPWLHLASVFGAQRVGKAYGGAIEDLHRYAKVRFGDTKYRGKARLSNQERRAIFEEAFEFPEEVGLLGHVFEDLDRIAFAGDIRTPGRLRYIMQEFPLKFFEKAEWMNRLVSVHAMKDWYVSSGRLKAVGKKRSGAKKWVGKADQDYEDFHQDARRLVQDTQFGMDVMNTPAAFLKYDLLANPLVKQFQTFALRAPTTFLAMGPRLGEGRRRIRGLDVEFGGDGFWGKSAVIGADLARAVGISAVIYEVGKNLAGADMSRGGVVESLTDVAGGDRWMQGGNIAGLPIPLLSPPFVSIGSDAIRGALSGDMQLLGSAISRTIPAGIAMQRALGILGNVDESLIDNALADLPGIMQKTFADWDGRLPDGRVPIYKGSGELIDYQPASQVVMRGLGVDLQAHRHAQNFDHWLQSQRDQILEARQQFLQSLVAGNVAKAQKIRKQFERRFGIPLTVSRAQLRARLKTRTTPRTERMLDRMPRELRREYARYAGQQAGRLGLSEEKLLAAETSSQRAKLFPRRAEPELTAEALQELRAAMGKATSPENKPIEERGYAPYKSF